MGPNLRYEESVCRFAESILEPAHGFLEKLREWLARIGTGALWNSLAQTLLKVTSPGIPDFYQGSELMDFRLADPDNRQPVDFAARRRVLGNLPPDPSKETLRDLLARKDGDALKMLVARAALRVRREDPALFLEGSYDPLEVRGPGSHRLLAFTRRTETREIAVLAGRFLGSLPADLPISRYWTGTEVPELSGKRVRDLLWGGVRGPGEEFRLCDALTPIPIAVLECLR